MRLRQLFQADARDWKAVAILAGQIPCSNDPLRSKVSKDLMERYCGQGSLPRGHVRYPRLADRPVRNSICQILTPRTTERHYHVESSIGALHIVLGIPVKHDETSKAQLRLEDAIHELVVHASVRIIDPVIGAHDGSHACMHTIHEGPQVIFV